MTSKSKKKKAFWWCEYRRPDYDDFGKWTECLSPKSDTRLCKKYCKLTSQWKCPYFLKCGKPIYLTEKEITAIEERY